MRQSAQLTSKLSLIVYATLLAAAVSAAAKESETRTFETKLGGQAGIAYRLEHLQSNYEVPARKRLRPWEQLRNWVRLRPWERLRNWVRLRPWA
jgi:hypothetical protein